MLILMNVAEYHNQATLIALEFTYNTLIIINIPARFLSVWCFVFHCVTQIALCSSGFHFTIEYYYFSLLL